MARSLQGRARGEEGGQAVRMSRRERGYSDMAWGIESRRSVDWRRRYFRRRSDESRKLGENCLRRRHPIDRGRRRREEMGCVCR
jgi:hypothetical protein